MDYVDDADYQALLAKNRRQRQAFAAGEADRDAGREFEPGGFDYSFYRLGYHGPQADTNASAELKEPPY